MVIITGTEGQHFCVRDHKEHTTVAHPTRVPYATVQSGISGADPGEVDWVASHPGVQCP